MCNTFGLFSINPYTFNSRAYQLEDKSREAVVWPKEKRDRFIFALRIYQFALTILGYVNIFPKIPAANFGKFRIVSACLAFPAARLLGVQIGEIFHPSHSYTSWENYYYNSLVGFQFSTMLVLSANLKEQGLPQTDTDIKMAFDVMQKSPDYQKKIQELQSRCYNEYQKDKNPSLNPPKCIFENVWTSQHFQNEVARTTLAQIFRGILEITQFTKCLLFLDTIGTIYNLFHIIRCKNDPFEEKDAKEILAEYKQDPTKPLRLVQGPTHHPFLSILYLV